MNPTPIAAVGYGMASATEARSGARFLTAKNLREALLSGLVGIGVVFLIFFARAELFGWRLPAYGALTGISIFVCCNTLFTLVSEPSHRRGVPRPLAAAIVFFFGGVLGRGISSLITESTGLARIVFSPRDLGIAFAVAGSLGLAVGLAFHFFGALERRLRESVERLKDVPPAGGPPRRRLQGARGDARRR